MNRNKIYTLPRHTKAFNFLFKIYTSFASKYCKKSEKNIDIIVDRARKGTENDAQKRLQIPPFCVTLFELELAFHIYRVHWVLLIARAAMFEAILMAAICKIGSRH